MPNFTLPGFTSGTAAVDPGSPAAGAMVLELLTKLMESAEAKAASARAEAAELCRSAFGVMRSRMEATTAARWCHYNDYIYYSIRLLNLVKQLSARHVWSFADSRRPVTDPSAILYPEELAWLYNELGLVCCCEGNMYDAIAVWEQGYEINKLVEEGARTGQFIVQSKLHLAHTFMELGAINTADQYLKETEDANEELNNEDYRARICGYKGLLAHLRGNLPAAEKCYEWATKCLGRTDRSMRRLRRPISGGVVDKRGVQDLADKIGGWSAGDGDANPRAKSIFLRHWADLKIKTKEYAGATELLRESRALAEAHDYPDLIAYARKSQGHLFRAQGDFPKARYEYEAAQAAARRMGIRRLEADLLSELSHLALDQRDAETARIRALEGMRIANELGLGLRQCHGLVVLGRANLELEQDEFGIACLQWAERLSRKSGYWLRAQEADGRLRDRGELPLDDVTSYS
jgi:tetratricopeptide (TPR) repeat protein